MFRCALLLSLMTIRSVVGQPGVWPTSPGGTNGSAAVEIWVARQRCVDDVGPSVHGALAILVVSAAANGTLVVATLAYGLPVPNSATKNSTWTVSARPGFSREMRANAKLPASFCGSWFCGWSLTNVGATLLRWFQTSLLT